MIGWWDLPGPGRFVDSIVRDIRKGRNVIVGLPRHAPERLQQAVQRQLAGVLRLRSITVESDALDPLELVYRCCVYEPVESGLRTAATLASEPSFSGQVIWVEDLPDCSRPEWFTLLAAYEHASRNISVWERTVFCLLVKGATLADLPTDEICLATHSWNGFATEMDMLLYASNLFRESRLPSPQLQVAIRVAASLSCWDPQLCDFLADCKLADLLEPSGVLKEFAINRNWSNLSSISHDEGGWSKGIAAQFEGTWELHSAALSTQSCNAEIRHRVWRAQVAVLLPFVEEARQKLLREFQEVLSSGSAGARGIDDQQNLEIGQINFELRQRRDISRKDLARVERLTRIRNDLAHLRVVSAAIIELATPT